MGSSILDPMKRLVLLVLASLSSQLALGQEFLVEDKLAFLASPSTLIASESGWVAASSGNVVFWSSEEGDNWRSISGQSLDKGALSLIGDSLLVLVDGSLFGIAADQDSIELVIRPPNALTSAFASAGETWVTGGRQGVSRSIDRGATWSPIDSIFTTQCCAGEILLRHLRGGQIAAFATVGLSEMNGRRLLYSGDGGETWSDSTSISISHGDQLVQILSGRSHVEIQLHGSGNHLARRTWGEGFVPFSSGEDVEAATYSDRWGVVAATIGGLLRLDESDLTWHALGPPLVTRLVAAGADGKLWVTDQQKRLLLYTPRGQTSIEPPHESSFELFPNPAGNFVSIKGLQPGHEYEIVDLLGRRQLVITSTSRDTRISVAGLAAGLYLIRPGEPYSGAGTTFMIAR